MRSAGLQFSLVRDSRRSEVDLVGDLSWLSYSGSAYQDEIVGSAAGRVRLGLLEDVLYWAVEDTFGQIRQDLFNVPNPDNRESINHFSTGPELRLALGQAASLQLGGRYTLVDYGRSQADSERVRGWFAAERATSGGGQLALVISGERIQPRGAATDPEYDRSAAHLTYSLSGSRTSISIDAGANRVSGGGTDDAGPLLRVRLERDLSAHSSIDIGIGHELMDPGASLALQPGGGVSMPDLQDGARSQTALPYNNSYLEAAWHISGLRTTASLSGRWSNEDFTSAGVPDLQRLSVGLSVSRAIRARTELTAGARYNRHDFDAPFADNEDIAYDLALAWAIGRLLRVEVAGERYSFSSDPFDVDETRYWLRLRIGGPVSRSAR